MQTHYFKLILSAGVILMTGCREFLTFGVTNTDTVPQLASEEFLEQCDENKFYVYDLAVAQKHCDKDCLRFRVIEISAGSRALVPVVV